MFAEPEKLSRKGVAEGKNLGAALSGLLKEHLKQSAPAKWVRNLLSQSLKLRIKSKSSKMGISLDKNIQETMGLNFNYKNYKTLINTGVILGLPVLGTIISVPYSFNAFLTNVQKKSGKIGIMKAMDKIDDARVFAPENVKTDEQTPLSNTENNLLRRKFNAA